MFSYSVFISGAESKLEKRIGSGINDKGLGELGQVDFAVLVGVHGLDHGLDGLVADRLVLVEKNDFARVGKLEQIDRARVVVVDEVEQSDQGFFVAGQRLVDVLVLCGECVQDVTVVKTNHKLEKLFFF